jgi:hypothetical protein
VPPKRRKQPERYMKWVAKLIEKRFGSYKNDLTRSNIEVNIVGMNFLGGNCMSLKKAMILGIMFLQIFLSKNACFGQTNSQIIIGYDKVAWGASLNDVRKNYSGLIEKTNTEEIASGIKRFRQDKPENLMTYRDFYFYNDKLYKVGVSYDDLESMQIARLLLEKFVEKFGKFDDSDEGKYSVGNGIYYVDFTDYYRYYYSSLSIRVRLANVVIQRTQTIDSLFMFFEYYNPVTENQIERESAQKKLGDIKL